MGWLFMNRPKGFTDQEWFAREFGPEFSARVRGTATKGGVFYAAVESEDQRLAPDEDGKTVIALVCLVKWVPHEYCNWGYKDMTEFAGPVEAGCPEKILKMLSPFKPEILEPARKKAEEERAKGGWGYDSIVSAYEWRERCWAKIRAQKAMKPGATFKTPGPIEFTDGVQVDTVTLLSKQGRKMTWLRPDGRRVSLSRSVIENLQIA